MIFDNDAHEVDPEKLNKSSIASMSFTEGKIAVSDNNDNVVNDHNEVKIVDQKGDRASDTIGSESGSGSASGSKLMDANQDDDVVIDRDITSSGDDHDNKF